MKTIRVFALLSGNQYEHIRDEQGGKDIPVVDDVVYVKSHKTYVPTKKRILCADCGHPRSQCHCAAETPETLGQVVALQAERRGETPSTPAPPVQRPASVPSRQLGTFQSEAHAALACRSCGFVSCRCPVTTPGSTMDGVVTLQRAQGKRP
jgi:hypothetical protein